MDDDDVWYLIYLFWLFAFLFGVSVGVNLVIILK